MSARPSIGDASVPTGHVPAPAGRAQSPAGHAQSPVRDTPARPDPVIRLDQVQVRVGPHALLQVEGLTIAPGERVAVVGPNGAGKSTLLRLLSGVVATRQGSVRVLGREIGPQARVPLTRVQWRALRAELGLVMQGLHLVPRLTARENVLIGGLARLRGLDAWRGWVRWHRPEVRAQADAALDALGLSARAGTRADRLSGGERQKVGVARLRLQQPRLILADEPTSALDPHAVRQVCAVLRDTAGAGTLVSVLHQREVLPLLATRVIGMAGGRIVWDLPIDAVDDARLDGLYRLSGACRAEATATSHVPDPLGARPANAARPIPHPSKESHP